MALYYGCPKLEFVTNSSNRQRNGFATSFCGGLAALRSVTLFCVRHGSGLILNSRSRGGKRIGRLCECFANKAWGNGGGQHGAIFLLGYLQALEKRLDVRIHPLGSHGAFCGMKQAKKRGRLFSDGSSVLFAGGEGLGLEVKGAYITSGHHNRSRPGEEYGPAPENRWRTWDGGLDLHNSPAYATERYMFIVFT